MPEYIEREALLKEFDEIEPDECYDDEHDVWLDCRLSAIQAPTADVVEVRHGEWLYRRLSNGDIWDCSECKTLGSPQWKWCPICGAKMDGE